MNKHIKTFTICDTDFTVIPLSDELIEELRECYPDWTSDDLQDLLDQVGMEALTTVLILGLVTDDTEALIENTKRFVEKMLSIKDPEVLKEHLTELIHCVAYIACTPTDENLKTQLKYIEFPAI